MLGVLGGMGPAASAYFTYRLALLTDVRSDQEHLPVILINDPRIPDRSEAMLGSEIDPLPGMQRGLKLLEANGCTCAVIPCNTAHHWYEALKSSVRMPLIHIVESVIEALREKQKDHGRIALLGTPATIGSDLYTRKLIDHGYTVLPLSQDDIRMFCVRPIQAVKQNRLQDAATALSEAIAVLHSRGAEAVILGCTELPVALAELGASELNVPVIDSIDALAVRALKHYGIRVRI